VSAFGKLECAEILSGLTLRNLQIRVDLAWEDFPSLPLLELLACDANTLPPAGLLDVKFPSLRAGQQEHSRGLDCAAH
jgi:hypothetical protein